MNDDNGKGRAKNGKKFRKKYNAKEVVTKLLSQGWCKTDLRQTENEHETGSMQVTSIEVGALRVQSRAWGNSCTKGLLIVKGLIDGEEIEAVADMGATHSLISNLSSKSWDWT
ncbi:hypothetical protein Salat_1205200 [Sesamum alatum]|uniref:FMN-dependent dehydrogenase domain-containing protein n=1 Tax=Sesamum alatum TaxID=300844 RepID=A0AAE1YFE2_9LAMI|nr:hypothetical protein Salat_1205200 [Sesamum alatum]